MLFVRKIQSIFSSYHVKCGTKIETWLFSMWLMAHSGNQMLNVLPVDQAKRTCPQFAQAESNDMSNTQLGGIFGGKPSTKVTVPTPSLARSISLTLPLPLPVSISLCCCCLTVEILIIVVAGRAFRGIWPLAIDLVPPRQAKAKTKIF